MNKAQYKAYRHNQKSRRVYYEEPLHYPKSTERQSREDIFFRKIPLDLGDIHRGNFYRGNLVEWWAKMQLPLMGICPKSRVPMLREEMRYRWDWTSIRDFKPKLPLP